MKTVLHVGCGPENVKSMPAYFQDGMWEEIRFDIDPSVDPDIVGLMQDMSLFEDGYVDAVYSKHNIEHVSSFEVPGVLAGFRRVINDDGFLAISCPDMLSVAQAITDGALENPLYISPAGPISALDIVYGHQASIENGKVYMAHKTAFTANTLARHLLAAGFQRVDVVRDRVFGLHAVAFSSVGAEVCDDVALRVLPASEYQLEILRFQSDS